MAPNNASQRRYPPERKDPAVRMVREAIADRGGERFGAVVASPSSRASGPPHRRAGEG